MKLHFFVFNAGEEAAGFSPFTANVEIDLKDESEADADTVEFFRKSIADFYDGAKVYTDEEFRLMADEDIDQYPKLWLYHLQDLEK